MVQAFKAREKTLQGPRPCRRDLKAPSSPSAAPSTLSLTPALPAAPLSSLLVCVEGGVGEALPLVLHEELAVAHADVVDLIA